MTRTYDNTRRAAAAAETADRIAAATEALLLERPVPEVTLQAVAERAGVTVQTVLRHMESRDGCFLAVANRLRARVTEDRGESTPGDVGAALAGLMRHYERDGRLVLALVAQERSDSLGKQAVDEGRAFHRAWVERCFGPLLPAVNCEAAIDALVAATDLFVWKLLRLDLGRDPESTLVVLTRLVRGALEPQ